MKIIQDLFAILLICLILTSCEKDDETPLVFKGVENIWVEQSYENGIITYKKANNFDEGKPGIGLKEDGAFVQREVSGYCGRFPGTYSNFEGTWNVHSENKYNVNVGSWNGNITYQLEVVAKTETELKVRQIQPTGLKGVWESKYHNYLITTNTDVEYVDIFGHEWTGSVKLNGKEIETDNIYFMKDNVFGQYHLFSSNLNITFYSGGFTYTYQGNEYFFNSAYTFDTTEGRLEASGKASHDNELIGLQINLNAQKITLKSGVETRILDPYSFDWLPILKLEFKDGGKVSAEFLDIDVVHGASGTWFSNENTLQLGLNLLINNQTINREFIYRQVDPYLLKLIVEQEYDSSAIYSIIPETVISSLRYESIYTRDISCH